jgi:hypothetical protein
MRDFAKADPHTTSARAEKAAKVFTDLFYTGTTDRVQVSCSIHGDYERGRRYLCRGVWAGRGEFPSP